MTSEVRSLARCSDGAEKETENLRRMNWIAEGAPRILLTVDDPALVRGPFKARGSGSRTSLGVRSPKWHKLESM